jgi:hypothetical protein
MPTTPERQALQEQINEIDRLTGKVENQDVRDRLLAIKNALAAIMRGDKT